MRCIFCKQNSDNSKSIEHIIPESLGNTEHLLPPGVVCDKCNNYFSRKVEEPFVNSHWMMHIRNRQEVPNKNNLIPPMKGVNMRSGVEVYMTDDAIYPAKEKEIDKLIQSILQPNFRLLFLVNGVKPEKYIVSRFLCKVALEALAQRLISNPQWQDEIVDKLELDPLRNYVRLGNNNLIWEFNERILYDEDTLFLENGTKYQTLHEYTICQIEENELIFVFALFGIEFAVSYDRPSIEGYRMWLKQNNDKSPLYP